MLENPEIITTNTQFTAVIARTVKMTELRDFYDHAFTTVARTLANQGVTAVQAFGRYNSMPADSVDVEVGFTTPAPINPEGDVVVGELPGGEQVHAIHVGSYDDLGDAWRELYDWAKEQGHQVGKVMWEVYLTEPGPDTDPATMRTGMYWPLV